MMTLFVKRFVKNREEVSNPNVKKAYAALSSVAGILFNLFLCIAKIIVGLFSNSVAISADGFNNLSDAGTSLASFWGFKIAKYGGGNIHPFGHGRIEWIMGIFAGVKMICDNKPRRYTIILSLRRTFKWQRSQIVSIC